MRLSSPVQCALVAAPGGRGVGGPLGPQTWGGSDRSRFPAGPGAVGTGLMHPEAPGAEASPGPERGRLWACRGSAGGILPKQGLPGAPPRARTSLDTCFLPALYGTWGVLKRGYECGVSGQGRAAGRLTRLEGRDGLGAVRDSGNSRHHREKGPHWLPCLSFGAPVARTAIGRRPPPPRLSSLWLI